MSPEVPNGQDPVQRGGSVGDSVPLETSESETGGPTTSLHEIPRPWRREKRRLLNGGTSATCVWGGRFIPRLFEGPGRPGLGGCGKGF